MKRFEVTAFLSEGYQIQISLQVVISIKFQVVISMYFQAVFSMYFQAVFSSSNNVTARSCE